MFVFSSGLAWAHNWRKTMIRDVISHELGYIWITGDGKRFLDKEKAVKHQKQIRKINEFKNRRVSSYSNLR